MAYNSKEKLSTNIKAIKAMYDWQDGIVLTEDKVQALLNYSGFGGLKGVLFGDGDYYDWVAKGASKADLELWSLYQELFTTLVACTDNTDQYKEIVDSIKNSILTAFYTPPVVINTFYDVLKDYKLVGSVMEPSAGSGAFVLPLYNYFPYINKITCYEKDIMTGKILEAIAGSCPGNKAQVHIQGFEESNSNTDGKYDLVTSNIPYGAISVYDPSIQDRNITGKIHNYFFAKGLHKLKDGGILAYLVTDAFLNSPSNRSARKYVFERADFISLTVMPHNLMKDIANTEAPSHFLVVRRNFNKTEADMTQEEQWLCESTMVDFAGVKVPMNSFIQYTDYSPYVGVPRIGKNQYGKSAVEVDWKSPIQEIENKFREILVWDFQKRFGKSEIEIPVEQMVSQLEQDGENLTWEYDIVNKQGNGIIDRIEDTNIQEAELAVQDLQKEIPVQPSDDIIIPQPFKKGVLVKAGDTLVNINILDEDRALAEVANVKPGRETDILTAYINVRNSYLKLEEAQNKM